jgi:serine/threonine protein kinase/tetratricopeptide (TPR) repeat protein
MHDAIRLGSFFLGAPIGRGGMAQVWSGTHAGLGVPVALKVLDADLLDARSQADAVRREVEAMAGLSNPHIVMVFDQGRVPVSHDVLPHGAPWIGMELAPGMGLQRRADLTWSGVRAVLEALLDALAHAHARGVVHRDLKPSNVLVDGPSHRPDSVKLTDFGIATAARALTSDGTLRGTPRYMAPEQFRNLHRDIGPWTDLYALGCLAWQAVTGSAPYTAKEPARVAHQHLNEEPPPFRPRVPVPEGLEPWLRRLLIKHPAWRYQRAADAQWALQELCSHTELIPAATPGDPEVPEADETLVGLLQDKTDVFDTLSDFVVDDPMPQRLSSAPPRPLERPPVPVTWRREEPPAPPAEMIGAALSLYGLRVVPLVGRGSERDLLWEQFRAVEEERRPRAVLLEGPAGIGKSTLAQWMCERLHEVGGAITMAAMHDSMPGARHGLGPMVARELRITGLPPSEAITAIERTLAVNGARSSEDARDIASLACPSPELPPPRLASERHAIVRRVISMRSKVRPVVVWLDDPLWSADSLRFVEHLLDRSSLPVLVVLTVQDEALDQRPAAKELVRSLSLHPRLHRVRVGPMRADEIRELVRQHLRVSDDLAAKVAQRSNGNPLFSVQLLGDWVQRDLFLPAPDGFRLRSDRSIPLPDRLHDVWVERLTRLLAVSPEGSAEALEIAAALGDTVDTEEWMAVTRAAGLSPPHGLLGRLVRSGLALPTEDGWRFAHVMLRESISKTSQETGRWTMWNLHAARVLEDRTTDDGLARLGRHLLEAGQYAEGIPHLLEACRRRLHRDEAPATWPLLELLRETLEHHTAADDPRRATLDLLRARALKARPDLDTAHALARGVEETARGEGWERLEAEALTEQADIARVRGDLPEAVRAFHRALDRYAALEDMQGVADSLRSLAHVAIQLGETIHARHLLADARRRYAELADPQGEAMCLAGLGDIARLRRDWQDAVDAYRAALTLFRELGHRSGMALGLHGLAEVNRLTGRLADAEEGYREVIHIDEAIGRDPSIPTLNLALCLIESSQFEDAEAQLEQLEHRWRSENRPGYLAVVHIASLQCCAARQDWSSWEEHAVSADELLHATSLVDLDIARLAEQAGDMAAALHRPDLAAHAWETAHDQWAAMGDEDRAAVLARRLGHA